MKLHAIGKSERLSWPAKREYKIGVTIRTNQCNVHMHTYTIESCLRISYCRNDSVHRTTRPIKCIQRTSTVFTDPPKISKELLYLFLLYLVTQLCLGWTRFWKSSGNRRKQPLNRATRRQQAVCKQDWRNHTQRTTSFGSGCVCSPVRRSTLECRKVFTLRRERFSQSLPNHILFRRREEGRVPFVPT